MKRYRYTGRPDRPWPFAALADRTHGEEFDWDMDRDTENYLVGVGAVQIIAKAPKPVEPKAKTPKAATPKAVLAPVTPKEEPHDAESKPGPDKPSLTASGGGFGDGEPKPVGGATHPAGKPTGKTDEGKHAK